MDTHPPAVAAVAAAAVDDGVGYGDNDAVVAVAAARADDVALVAGSAASLLLLNLGDQIAREQKGWVRLLTWPR